MNNVAKKLSKEIILNDKSSYGKVAVACLTALIVSKETKDDEKTIPEREIKKVEKTAKVHIKPLVPQPKVEVKKDLNIKTDLYKGVPDSLLPLSAISEIASLNKHVHKTIKELVDNSTGVLYAKCSGNKLVMVVEFQHVKPGKGPAFVRIKYKNLKTGSIVEQTFNTNLKLEKAHVDKLHMQYLYNDGTNYVFMNNEDYTQLEIPASVLGDDVNFLKENLEIEVSMYDGEILGITLPEKVDYEVIETTDAVKGNTTNNAMKDATIETGYVVKVPMFIGVGEKILITTKDGKYSSRA